MPEGDTVWRTAHRLHEVFAGHALVRTDLRWPGISTTDLTGRTSIDVIARGKHLLHRVEGGWTIHSHLRMEGSWRIERTATPPAALGATKVRAVLATATYTAVGWSLGMLDLVHTTDEGSLVGHLGPDVLGPGWDPDRAITNLAAAPASIASALLDQRNLAGLGTLWTSESLFLERLDPWTPASAVPRERLERLVARAHKLLHANIGHAIQSSTGLRAPGQEHYAHGRNRRPCRVCGTPIRIGMEGPPTQERTIYHCPTCQGVGPVKPPPRTRAPRH